MKNLKNQTDFHCSSQSISFAFFAMTVRGAAGLGIATYDTSRIAMRPVVGLYSETTVTRGCVLGV